MTKTNFLVTLGAAVLSGVLLLAMALEQSVAPKFLEMNKKAFALGAKA